jgi:uncharacterized protein with HEPN domain
VRDDFQRLADIRDAIERIDKYSVRGREAFDREDWIQVWVVHHLQIIGEAARGLSEAMRERLSEVPWRQIVGMRHILVHQYFEIDRDLVWSVVQAHLPLLKESVAREL